MNLVRWQTLTLAKQMGHIGSEITRARVWQEQGDSESSFRALERAANLIELSMNSESTGSKLSEISRLREVVLDNSSGSFRHQYDISLQYLENYCNQFSALTHIR